MGSRLTGYVLMLAALAIAGTVFFLNSRQSEEPLVFSPAQVLNSTWLNYKNQYLEPGTGRTLDKQRGNITTSEGESYTMLRAVWQGDKATFDQSWTWTKNDLQHKSGDRLFAWLFGRKPDGTYGILTAQGGNTTASDADTDIAVSLLFAYARWQDKQYLGDARVIMDDIWSKEVLTIQGAPYLLADNLEESNASPVAAVDPSYLNPAAYHLFAKFDSGHPWNALADSSYTLLGRAMAAPLDKKTSAGLPPDWITVNKTTGALGGPQGSGNTTDFSYDALRVPWRLALDYAWFKDPRATSTLSRLGFLAKEWHNGGALATAYAHNGAILDNSETPSMYGGTLGYFMLEDPSAAKEIYQSKLLYLYDPGTNAWKATLSYYDDNWAYFGIALYNNLLPNLTAHLPQSAFEQ